MEIRTLLKTRFEHILNERRSRQSLTERNLKKFRKLVAHANSTSPYYARIIKKNSIDITACTPGDFPVLTKRDVMENFDHIITVPHMTKRSIADFLAASKDPLALYDGKYYILHTSGSSGEIGYFVYSRQDWARGFAHVLRIHDFKLRRKKLAFFGATKGHFAGISFVTTGRRSLLKLLYRIAAFDINSPLQPVLDGLNAFQPDILTGYPSALTILARKQESGELAISPTSLESSGEPVAGDDGAIIQKAFKTPLVNLYSCTEHMFMGVAKPGASGMYVFEDDLIFNFRDDHTCVTNLFNYTLPLIRYRMEDVLRPLPDKVGILPYTMVREIVGRMEQAPLFLNRHGIEDFISPHIINEFHVKHLRRFQMQLLDKTSFLFKACFEPGIRDEQKAEASRNIQKRMREILAEKEMDTVTFTIKEFNDLCADERTGKFKLIVS
ncbi:MAG TPA: hypothetical protein DCO77_04930 [Nitrospiraceae bacterium]|nr:hypothetical protein [Nitrospiraceae bacterium]